VPGNTWLAGAVAGISLEQFIEQAVFTAYRLGAYVLLNWAEDPALLAIVFC
jgi:hypothetical protein